MSLKICYLLPRLLPTPSGTVVGGAAANCVSLALELKRQGADVELLASVSADGIGYLAGEPLAEILGPLPCAGRGLVGRGFGALHALRRGLKDRLKRTHFDVVHSHSGTYPYAVVPLVADRRTSVRLHSLYCPLGARGGVYSDWWERPGAARLAFERLDRIIAVTENVRQSVADAKVRPDKIQLVPMSVDTRRFHPGRYPSAAKYFPNHDRSTRILFVGNASNEKGLLELLQAVKLLSEKNMALFLVAAVENQCGIKEYSVGYDLARSFVRQANLANRVRFVGLVVSIEELYSESDIVVIPWKTSRGPSDYPMVVLEAMAMGKCVVSTPVGSCPDLLAHGKAGILTSGYSSEDIAAAIEFAVTNPMERRSLEQRASERAADFSLTRSAGHLLSLYEHLLENKPRHHVRCGL